MEDYTINELIACFLSREFKDGEKVMVGANLAVPRAGVLLAHLLNGPNMQVYLSGTLTNLFNQEEIGHFKYSRDWRAARWADANIIHNEVFDDIKRITDMFIVGGIQIDKYGNSNLFGIGDYQKFKFRGPGAIGTPTMSTFVKRYYLFVPSHTKKVLVDKCDFISAYGYGAGGKDARIKYHLPGGGPKYCITPLAIMDFEEETKHMRLKSIHPGVTLQQVVDNTGFNLIIPERVPVTDAPTDEELKVLRERVDKEGLLR